MPSTCTCPHCNQSSELAEGNVSTNTQTASLNLWELESRIANDRKSFFIETRLYTCARCGRSSIFLIVRTNYKEPKGIPPGLLASPLIGLLVADVGGLLVPKDPLL
jgi:hypothetical protein